MDSNMAKKMARKMAIVSDSQQGEEAMEEASQPQLNDGDYNRRMLEESITDKEEELTKLLVAFNIKLRALLKVSARVEG